MAKHFFITWLAYWLAILILPVRSIYPEVYSAFLLQISFVALVLIGYFGVVVVGGSHKPLSISREAKLDIARLIKFSLLFSVIGTLFLIYDKLYVQNIDYSQGVAVAREAWRREGEQRAGGVSSIFSVLGYLLSSGYFVAATLLVIVGNELSTLKRLIIVLLIFILLMTNSFLAGGRSNVLLIAVFVVGAIAATRSWSFKEIFSSSWLRLIIYILSFSAFVYVLYVFSERAKATGVDPLSYLNGFLPYLGLELNSHILNGMGEQILANVSSLLILSTSYITHSFSTTAAIMQHGPGSETIVFVYPMKILFKLGLTPQPDSAWFLAGRFPSLPGALYYQFGLFGYSSIAFLIGMLSGIARVCYFLYPSSVLLLCFYLTMYSVLLVSPLLLVIDFMSFPFVVVSFIFVALTRKSFEFIKLCVADSRG